MSLILFLHSVFVIILFFVFFNYLHFISFSYRTPILSCLRVDFMTSFWSIYLSSIILFAFLEILIGLTILNLHLLVLIIILWSHSIFSCRWLFSFTFFLLIFFIQDSWLSNLFLIKLLSLNVLLSNFLWIEDLFSNRIYFLLKFIYKWFNLVFHEFF